MANGFILYEGPSHLDGKPIVVIATTGKTRNEKTGDMVQTWIMRQDIAPHHATKTGDDASICGNCPHRGRNGAKRSCYVTVHQAPLAIWKAYLRGAYSANMADALDAMRGRLVRIGAYGDPLAAPTSLWQDIVDVAKGWTGYTHQWANPALHHVTLEIMRGLLMASCDTETQAREAHAKGWRTFRTLADGETPCEVERVCMAEERGLSCATCRKCNGTLLGDLRPSIVIHVHGSGARNYHANCRA